VATLCYRTPFAVRIANCLFVCLFAAIPYKGCW